MPTATVGYGNSGWIHGSGWGIPIVWIFEIPVPHRTQDWPAKATVLAHLLWLTVCVLLVEYIRLLYRVTPGKVGIGRFAGFKPHDRRSETEVDEEEVICD